MRDKGRTGFWEKGGCQSVKNIPDCRFKFYCENERCRGNYIGGRTGKGKIPVLCMKYSGEDNMKRTLIKTKFLKTALTAALAAAMLSGCAGNGNDSEREEAIETERAETEENEPASGNMLLSDRAVVMPAKDDPYRTFYEVFVYSFYDSDNDGIGDLNGLTHQLDYLNDGDNGTDEDLGITGLWLMPIMPSETYHKYDVKDYMDIDSEYGTMEDFDKLIAECDKRDINVIIDLVMNHTSSAHPWFMQACDYLKQLGDGEVNLEDCPYVDYYHFTKEQKSAFYQVEGTDWYYEAQFWSEMPDLNLESEAVREEFRQICQFWIEHGAAGFRMDAVKEYETGNATANVETLKWFMDMVRQLKPDCYVVGEAWCTQSEYAVYYESGIDSLFDFAFADRDGIISNVLNGRAGARTYAKNVVEAEKLYASYYSDYINAPFYTNHDMGRSAGYYAGEQSEAQTKMAGALNLLMSGNAFLYYGEELGMKGSGKDENKRLGMLWDSDSESEGMCDGPVDADAVKMKYGSLKEQQEAPDSIYQYYRNVIRLRNQFPAIVKGSTVYEEAVSNESVCVMTKTYGEESVILVCNVSDGEQTIDLSGVGSGVPDKPEATLLTGTEDITAENGTITLPPYSIVIFAAQQTE